MQQLLMAQKQVKQGKPVMLAAKNSAIVSNQKVDAKVLQKVRYTVNREHESEEEGWFTHRSQQNIPQQRSDALKISKPVQQKQVIVVPANQILMYKSIKPVDGRNSQLQMLTNSLNGEKSQDTIKEQLSLPMTEGEIDGQMQQPHKSGWNQQHRHEIKKFQLLKNLSESKLDYQNHETTRHEHWGTAEYHSTNSAKDAHQHNQLREYIQQRREATPELEVINGLLVTKSKDAQKQVKQKRQKFIQPSLLNSAQVTQLSSQPGTETFQTDLTAYSSAQRNAQRNEIRPDKIVNKQQYPKQQQSQTRSMNKLLKVEQQFNVMPLSSQYGGLKIQDLQDGGHSLSLGDAKLGDQCSAQKVKNMIKLVKSSTKKLHPDQLQSIRDSVSKNQQMTGKTSVNQVYKEKDDVPTPKATSKIILKASKANTNLISSQPPLKNKRGSQDSSTIQQLAKELRQKGMQQKLKIGKQQKSMNLSHNVQSIDQHSDHQKRREKSNDGVLQGASSTKHRREDQKSPLEISDQLRFADKHISGKAVTKVGKSRQEEIVDSNRLRLQKLLSKTARIPSGFLAFGQALNEAAAEVQLEGSLDFSKTQLIKPNYDREKIVSPRKIDQAMKGMNKLKGDQAPLKQSVMDALGANTSAMSSFTQPSQDHRLNEIQKIERNQQSLNYIGKPSKQQQATSQWDLEPAYFVKQMQINQREMSPRNEVVDKTSFGESDSLDVDEEVGTRAHFEKLQEMHQPKPRISTLQPTPNSKKNEENYDNQPENVRESRKISDARDLMFRHSERIADNNRIVSAGNDAFSSRVDQLKSEAEKAEERHKNRLRQREEQAKSVPQDVQKVINTSIQPRNKSKFFNPSDKLAASQAPNNANANQFQIKTKSALSEMYPSQKKFYMHSDESPNTPEQQGAYLVQPQRLFGSRKPSRMLINYFKLFLIPQYQVLTLIMQYLPLDTCFRLRLVSLSKSCARDPTLRGSFEVQFFKAIIQHRHDYQFPNPATPDNLQASKLCDLLAAFLQSKFQLTHKQGQELAQSQAKNDRKRMQLNMSADTATNSLLETGIGFEIQKDVDRTFQDCVKFSASNRKSLATVLKAFAMLDTEIGYVQGLNFIVGNFILMFDRFDQETCRTGNEIKLDSISAQKRCERKVLAAFFGLLKVLQTRDFYTEQMLGIKEAIFKLECILYNLIPEVYIYLMQHQITLEYFVSQWFLTMFQYDINNHEQCMMIILLCLFFGQKIMFQIAFQMIKEIRSRLVNFSYEEALVYLKDYAGEARFSKVEFLMRALENDLITERLIKDLGKIYQKFRSHYSEKEMQSLSFLDSNPLSQRVRFLRDSMPGKINIKVIWPHAGMSDSPNFDKAKELDKSGSSSVSVSKFSLKLEAAGEGGAEEEYEERETMIIEQKQKNFRQVIQQMHPSSKSTSMHAMLASEESRKNRAVQALRPSNKRVVGSFILPANGKGPTSNSFSELAPVSERSHKDKEINSFSNINIMKNTEVATEFLKDQQLPVPKTSMAGINNKANLQEPRKNKPVFDVQDDDDEIDQKVYKQTGSTSLFERLGIQQQAVPTTNYMSQSRDHQKQTLFFIQPNLLQPTARETSQRSSEQPSYLLRQRKDSTSSNESGNLGFVATNGIKQISNVYQLITQPSNPTTGIKIYRHGDDNQESSASKTHSDNVSQETDQLESENSYPLVLKLQQTSSGWMHVDRPFEAEELMDGNEYSTIDPPLFLSPHASNQINSRAIYRKDNNRVQSNLQAYEKNLQSARNIRDEPQVRPGTKTKLDPRNHNNIQPTQSNFDVESENQTLSHTLVQSGMKYPTSPSFLSGKLKTQKVMVSQHALKLQPSENIIESDKRLKKVNNIALQGAGFDNPKHAIKQPIPAQKQGSMKSKQLQLGSDSIKNIEFDFNDQFEHLPLKETFRTKQQPGRFLQPMTPDPVLKTIDLPMSTDRPMNLPSQQMQVLRNPETKKMQPHQTTTQITEEEQPMQQAAPLFMQKFLMLNKELKPKTSKDSMNPINMPEHLSAGSSEPMSPNDKNTALRQQEMHRDFKEKHQADYNTKDNFNTVRFATQKKIYQVPSGATYPQPKHPIETPNTSQTLPKHIINAAKKQ